MSSSSAATKKIITIDHDDSPNKTKPIASGTKRKSSLSPTLASKASKSEKTSTPPKKKKSPSKQKPVAPSCSYEVKIPSAISSSTIQKTMLVQISPEQQSNFDLEFEGSSGAIGRFEATDKHVTLDLKGHQFCGLLHSGPTAMIVSLVGNKPGMSKKTSNDGDGGGDGDEQRVAKVEAIMNEFVTLEQTQDIMSMLDGTVDKGTIGNDDDVNDGDGDKEEEDGDGSSSNENSSNKNDKDTTIKEQTNKTKNERKPNVRQKKSNTNRRKS